MSASQTRARTASPAGDLARSLHTAGRVVAAHRVVLALLAAAALTRFTWIGSFGLMGDEAYYWDWSRHLAFGYYDHPPVIAWLIRTSTTVFGATEFGVRVSWAVLGSALVGIAYLMGVRAGTRSGGIFAALLVLTGPVFLATCGLATPDGLALFWWGVTLLALQRALGADGNRWWAACGVAFGLGLESKYTVVLLLPAILLAMLATVRGRVWLVRPGPYLAASVAAVIFAPNVVWNASNQWVTMSFQLRHGQDQAASGLSIIEQTQAYLLTEAGIAMPLALVVFAAGSLAALAIGLRRGDTMLLVLALSALGTFVFFMVLNGMEHWTVPAYESAAIACGILGGRVFDAAASRRTTGAARMAVLALGALLLVENAVPSAVLVGSLRAGHTITSIDADLIQQLLDETTRGPALGQEIDSVLHSPEYAGRRPIEIIAYSWSTAALEAFYTPGHPRAYSIDHQYDLWGGMPDCPNCQVVDLGE